MDLSVSGPLVALLLASVILSKEMLSSAGKETITVGRYLNVSIVILLFVFIAQIVLMVAGK